MEFNIRLDAAEPDLAGIEQHLQGMDPAGLVDFDSASGMLRVSTTLSELEIAAFLRASGHAVDALKIERQPSTCCGGCGG